MSNPGNFTFVGQRFDADRLSRSGDDKFDEVASEPRIKSALLQQGTQKIWVEYDPSNTDAVKEGVVYYQPGETRKMVSFNFGDLSKKFVEGQPISLSLYGVGKNEVETEGAPPIAGISDWRTTKTGIAKSMTAPVIENITNLASPTGELKGLTPGTPLLFKGKGLVFPGPDSQVLVISVKDEDGKARNYAIGPLQRTEDWINRNNLSNDDTVTVVGFIRKVEDILSREITDLSPTKESEESTLSGGVPLKDGGGGIQPSTVGPVVTQTKSILDTIRMGPAEQQLPALLEQICIATQICDQSKAAAAEVAKVAAELAAAQGTAAGWGATLSAGLTLVGLVASAVAVPVGVISTVATVFTTGASGKDGLVTAAELDFKKLGQLAKPANDNEERPSSDTIWFLGAYHPFPLYIRGDKPLKSTLEHVLIEIKSNSEMSFIVNEAKRAFLNHLKTRGAQFSAETESICTDPTVFEFEEAIGNGLLPTYGDVNGDYRAIQLGKTYGYNQRCLLPFYLIPLYNKGFNGTFSKKIEIPVVGLSMGYCSTGWAAFCGLKGQLAINMNDTRPILGELYCGQTLFRGVRPANALHGSLFDCFNRSLRVAYYHDAYNRRFLSNQAWNLAPGAELVISNWRDLIRLEPDINISSDLFQYLHAGYGYASVAKKKSLDFIISKNGTYLPVE